jgi:hypothetical protein
MNLRNISFALLTFLLSGLTLQAQEEEAVDNTVFGTFKSSRIINAHSTEMLRAKHMDVRITHRFGDVMKDWDPRNSWDNLFGIEDASDILVGFEFGLTDNLMIGISRTKGGGDMRQLMNGFVKYRPLAQTDDGKMPLSLAVVGSATWITMRKTPFDKYNPTLSSFDIDETPGGYFARRWRYSTELHISRKFSERFSLQLSPIFVWRNLVRQNESNALLSINLGTRIQVSKGMGILLDTAIPIIGKNGWGETPAKLYFPLGLALEFETAGHIFQVNFTNSRGIVSTDYIGDTQSGWGNGEFRVGFTISRIVQLKN